MPPGWILALVYPFLNGLKVKKKKNHLPSLRIVPQCKRGLRQSAGSLEPRKGSLERDLLLPRLSQAATQLAQASKGSNLGRVRRAFGYEMPPFKFLSIVPYLFHLNNSPNPIHIFLPISTKEMLLYMK